MRMSKRKRARIVRRVATGAVVASAVGVAAAGVAVAARRSDPVLPKLPAPGATVEVDLASRGVELLFGDKKVNTGPLQGKATFEIESNDEDPASVRTRVGEFYLTSPAKRGGVTIALEASRRDEGRSVLRREGSRSPRFHHTVEVALKITVRYPEVLGLPAEYREPLTLTARDAAVLEGRVKGFPLSGSRYRLQGEAPLSHPGRAHGDAAILRFPIRVEGL